MIDHAAAASYQAAAHRKREAELRAERAARVIGRDETPRELERAQQLLDHLIQACVGMAAWWESEGAAQLQKLEARR